MLALGNYVQWKSRIRRYIDTKPHNSELVHYCLQSLHKRLSMGLRKQFPVADGSSEKQLQRALKVDNIVRTRSTRKRGIAKCYPSALLMIQNLLRLLKMRKVKGKGRLTNLMAFISLSIQENLQTLYQQQPSNSSNTVELIKIILQDIKEEWCMISRGGSHCCWARENVGDSNITIDSSDICYDRAQDDQDETDDLDQELPSGLDKDNDVNYESKGRNDCAKAKGDLMDFIATSLQQFETDKGRKFLNKTLHAYFAKEGIRHETSTAQTPEQNGVVERRNRTLVEAARTMLSAAKVPLFFWAEAIATACFTQNRSLIIPRHKKTPYHIIDARKTVSQVLSHLWFSLLSSEMVKISVFTELLQWKILLSGPKSSAVHATDNPDNRQQHNTTHTSTTTDVADPLPLNIHSTHQTPTQVPTVSDLRKTLFYVETIQNAQFCDDEILTSTSSVHRYKNKGRHQHFDGVQKSLVTEVRAMKAVFEEMEAEVDQNAIDKKYGEIERKNLLITNENLIANCIAQDVFYTVTDSTLSASRFNDLSTAYNAAMNRVVELESENSRLLRKIEHDDHDTMIKAFSKLEVAHVNLQLKQQHLKENANNLKSKSPRDVPEFDVFFELGMRDDQIQSHKNTIRKLKAQISELKANKSENNRHLEYKSLDSQNFQLKQTVTDLQNQLEDFKAENAKIKLHYQELFNSIKVTRAQTTEKQNSLQMKLRILRQLKGGRCQVS
ncbi:integrase, catalytic region, zinc finger, CCHC-type containing protein [Tanacetum coccineum]